MSQKSHHSTSEPHEDSASSTGAERGSTWRRSWRSSVPAADAAQPALDPSRLVQHHTGQKLPTKSLIHDAAEDRDFNALKEGLKYALGTVKDEANWLPEVTRKESTSDANEGDVVPAGRDLADNSSQMSDWSRRRDRDVAKNATSPFKDDTETVAQMSDLLHPNRPAPYHPGASFRDLEAGPMTPTIEITPDMPSSPAKFSNIINRVSERIAGTGTPNLSVDRPKTPSIHEASSAHGPSSSIDSAAMIDSIANDYYDVRKDHIRTETLGMGIFNISTTSVRSIQTDHQPISHQIPGVAPPLATWKHDVNSMYLFGKSMGIFPPTSSLRQACHRIVSYQSFSTFLLTLLFVQVCLLAYRHWNPEVLGGYITAGNNWADYTLIGINIIYTLEMFMKVIAYGFYDDRIMFSELGLPYPESVLAKSFVPEKLKNAIQDLVGRVQKGFRARKKAYSVVNPSFKSAAVADAESTEEIELQDLSERSSAQGDAHDASSMYGIQPAHHDASDLTASLVNPKQHLASANTFLKQKSTSNINTLHLRRAYIRNSWHRVDFVSIIMFWISMFLSIGRYDARNNITIFRALSTLRILRICNLTGGTNTILTALKLAIPQLIEISIFIACFWLFFGLIGVQSFKSSMRRHCVWYNPEDPNDTYVNAGQFCGSYTGLDGSPQPYLERDGTPALQIKGFRCPMYSRCETLDNPYGGTVSFDNIFYSLEMVFVVMSANTFTDIMYNTTDTDSLAACLFYIFAIFIMTVWLLNVFIAIVVSSFHITRSQVAKERSQRKDKLRMFETFGSSEHKAISMKNERLEELRKQNRPLDIYYKFEFLFIILIFLDLVTQCFRSYGMSSSVSSALYRIESAFTLVFVIEIVLRFALYLPSWRLFFKLKRNVFDLFLAIITGLIILGPIKERLGHAYYWLTVFQLMRFYRVVLATKITSHLWLRIMGNFKALFDLTLFFFVLLFLVSIIYSRFFENVVTAEEMEEGGFDYGLQTLPNTFVGLYIITSTENWTDILYHIQQYQNSASGRVFTAMLLIAWFILSNFVIMNVFIAIIASTLEVSEAEKKKKQLLQFIESITTSIHTVDPGSGALSKFKNRFFKRRDVKEEFQVAVVNLLLSGTAVHDFLDKEELKMEKEDQEIQELPKSKLKRWFLVNYKRMNYVFGDPFKRSKPQKLELSNFDPTDYAKNILTERNELINKQNRFLHANPTYNKVFYVIGPRHKVRRFCQSIVGSSYGERVDGIEPRRRVTELFVLFMFVMTAALVISACYVTPIYRKKTVLVLGYWNWTFYLTCVFVSVFSLEFIIKILADGLIFTPNGYLRSYWNHIDGVVLLSLWIEFIAYLKFDGDLSRIFRGLKALRALRLLTISETAKNNFQSTMIFGLWKIVNAGILSLCLLFPFAIWGLNIFNGRLGTCLDGESTMDECFNEYTQEVFNWEILAPNVYSNPQLQFDKFSTSLLTLFEITSLEGWTDLLNNVMASTGIGTVPEAFSSPFNGFFVILYNFSGMVFILSLFISVIIQNYSRSTGRAFMTDEQISWYHLKKYLAQAQPSKRKDYNQLNHIAKFCYRMTIEKNRVWQGCLNVILFFDVVALLLEAYPSTDGLNNFRLVVYLIASFAFSINTVMLIVGQGPRVFIKYVWNIFNLVVTFGAFATTLANIFVEQGSVFTNINKSFLMGMLFLIIPRSNRLSQLLKFASASLPHLISLLFTWVVLFLVFAIAMNQIFGATKIGPNGTDNLNLRSVPKALILLFRCSFGEGWNYIMHDYTLVEPYCYTDPDSGETDCGNKEYAYILFISWNIISMYIFLNMFVSLILDSFSYIMNSGKISELIKRDEIRKFKAKWQLFDREGTGYIDPKHLSKFLHSLDGALAFHFYSGELEIPVLCHKWFIRNDPTNPYDITVRYDEINNSFDSWNIDKIRERRQVFETFVEEAMLTMELNNEPGISFSRILLQLPLYTTFEAGECLNLIDFLERTLLLQKVRKRLHTKKVYETIAAYACRWKYRQNQRSGIRDTNIAFDKALRRKSYLSGELEDELDNDTLGAFFDENTNAATEEVLSHRRSGVYVPKSPITVSKKSQDAVRINKPQIPQFFIDHAEGPYSETSKDMLSRSRRSSDSFIEDNSDEEAQSILDVSQISSKYKTSQYDGFHNISFGSPKKRRGD